MSSPVTPRPAPAEDDRPLRLAYLSYRSKPTVGGQGIYTRHLTKAMVDLGHTVEVFSGQPYPVLDERIALTKLPSLDLFNDHYPGRFPAYWEIKSLPDILEVLQFSGGTFPEPLAFSYRAYRALKERAGEFDLVHDNQCLGYGILAVDKIIPTLVTLHHPITVDRRLEVEAAPNLRKRLSIGRWYSFVKMQGRVARRMPRIVVVSENSIDDIHHDMGVERDRMRLVHVGVDPDLFRPMPEVTRTPGRLITTASADVELKGLRFLLEAMAKLRAERDVTLTVIGRAKEGGKSAELIEKLGLADAITFVTGVPDERIVELYAESEVAVVPSLYEGFSLPAVEAMATATPLVATSGGAFPEVTGTDGETVLRCEPGDVDSLVAALRRGLDDPDLRRRVGEAGRERVSRLYTWRQTAIRTVEQYREVLAIREHARQAARPDPMLTVDYDRLDVRPGMRVLDLGAGFGRHAFATARLGANVVAADLAADEMTSTKDTFAAMSLAGELPDGTTTTCVQADGLHLPFADGSFDRIIASEVLEHVPDDLGVMAELLRVLAPGGRMAATVPAAVPEQICWWLNDEYHAPKSPGGHVRIYGEPELRTKLAAIGFDPGDSHRAHALHSPYWWLKCAVGIDNESNPLVKAYLKFLTWDIVEAPAVTRTAERILNPVLGKSLVIYADRPAVAELRPAA